MNIRHPILWFCLGLMLVCRAGNVQAGPVRVEKDVSLEQGRAVARYVYDHPVETVGARPQRFPLPVSSGILFLSKEWGELSCNDEKIKGRIIENELIFEHACNEGPASVRYGFTVTVAINGFADLFADGFGVPLAGHATNMRYRLHADRPVRIRWVAGGPGVRVENDSAGGNGPAKDFDWTFTGRDLVFRMSVAQSWSAIADRFSRLWEGSCRTGGLPAPDDIGLADFENIQPVLAAEKLQLFIRDRFRYQQTRSSENWRVPADCVTVWHRQYGDCKDISLMAAVILDSWGIEAFPVLIGEDGSGGPKSLPDPFSLNHTVLGIAKEDGYIMLDLWTGKMLKPDQSRIVLPLRGLGCREKKNTFNKVAYTSEDQGSQP